MNIKNDNKIWIKEFKIAILTKNNEKIRKLIEEFPSFKTETTSIKKEILSYLKQANTVLKQANDKLGHDMANIKLQQRLIGNLQYSRNELLSQYI